MVLVAQLDLQGFDNAPHVISDRAGNVRLVRLLIKQHGPQSDTGPLLGCCLDLRARVNLRGWLVDKALEATGKAALVDGIF